VQGSEPKPYSCSCPVGERCKHVAALAMKALLVLSEEQKVDNVIHFKLETIPRRGTYLFLRPRLYDPQTQKSGLSPIDWL